MIKDLRQRCQRCRLRSRPTSATSLAREHKIAASNSGSTHRPAPKRSRSGRTPDSTLSCTTIFLIFSALRDIEGCLGANESKLSRIGLAGVRVFSIASIK